jgi:hypothetical protein
MIPTLQITNDNNPQMHMKNDNENELDKPSKQKNSKQHVIPTIYHLQNKTTLTS